MGTEILLGTPTDYIDLGQYDKGGTFTVALPNAGLVMDIDADTANDVQHILNTINRYLTRAAESSRPNGHGERIELRFKLVNGAWAYIDVTGGLLSVPAETLTGAHLLEGAAWLQGVSLSLTCLPFGRLDPITYDVSDTFTHGDADAVYVVSNIPGDAPALCELVITDVSASDIIQRLRVAIRSGVALEAGDFTFVYDAANGTDGTEASEAGTIGGERSRVTTTTAYQQAAVASIVDRGYLEVIARIRDSSAQAEAGVVSWPNNGGPAPGSTGTLTAGVYRIVIAAMNGANVVAVSEPRTIELSGSASSDAIVNDWASTTGATDYRVYVKQDTAAYVYQTVGSATSSYTLTTLSGATTGNPPTAASVGIRPARLQATVALESITSVAHTEPFVSSLLGNDQWEDTTVLRNMLPPVTRSEHRDDKASTFVLNVRGDNADSLPDVDVDAFFVLPLDGYGMTVEWPGLDLAEDGLAWLLETNRYGESSAYANSMDSPNNAYSMHVLDGALYLEPHPQTNLVYVLPAVEGGVSSLGAEYTVRATVVPRWRTLGAAVPS